MPYQRGKRLGEEKASKLGHLEVIKSDLVNELIDKFEDPNEQIESNIEEEWIDLPEGEPLPLIFAVDGSKQTVRSDLPPFKEVSFVKSALLKLDKRAIEELDPISPHPMALRDIMADSAMYHSTVLPLKGVRFEDLNNYDAVRKIIYDSFKDESLNGEIFKTLKWLAYRKWSDENRRSPSFECPHCRENVEGLDYDADEGECACGRKIYLTDMIGFHLDMTEDSAPDSISTAYMLIHETMLLFTGIRYFWEKEKFNVLSSSLFLKDGPLTLRSQYSKLVQPIRELLDYANNRGIQINIAGQEKTGTFVDHLELIEREAPSNSYFILSNEYIRQEVQSRPERAEPYGYRTNYGNKVYVKLDEYHHCVLSIPTGDYKDSQSKDDFIGINDILATIPSLISHKHEGALVPIELANGVASLSSYPSATILKIFANI